MNQKPEPKADPVWSILPSYDMYQYTFNGVSDPPNYDETSSNHDSVITTSHNSSEMPTEHTAVTSQESLARTDDEIADSASSSSSPSLIVADEASNTWRETLLDNIDNLRNYSSSSNPYTRNVEVSVHFTENVGKLGETPKHIDPSHFEYKQGDFLNGYIYIQNKCPVPIPFDMFYVLFEGILTVTTNDPAQKSARVKVKKYLEMYDFAASWNRMRVDRLLSEATEDQHERVSLLDPSDGSYMGIIDRILMPGVLYKRFFTFKIPSRLLDTECMDHNLPSHTLLPPTLGLSAKEKAGMGKKYQQSNDFSYIDSSINYGVLARFIGRASNFDVNDKFNLATKLIDAKGDEFIIFTECKSFVRVVPEATIFSNAEKLVYAETSRILYDNLLGRIKEKIELGNQIRKALAEGKNPLDFNSIDYLIQNSDDHASQALKSRQLYTRLDNLTKETGSKAPKQTFYEIAVPIIKKKLLGPVKYQGMFQITTSKSEYILNYMSPKRFSSGVSDNRNLWQLEIPVKIKFEPADSVQAAKLPHITRIIPELVVCTLKGGQHPIPIELTHDHLFKNKSCKLVNHTSLDNFENIVKKPMREYAKDLYGHIKELGSSQFKVEKSLLEDICALAAIEMKTNILSLRQAMLVEKSGGFKSLENPLMLQFEEDSGSFSKEFSIVVDATKAQKLAPKQEDLPAEYTSVDQFCLVPSFQSCGHARMYYIRLVISLSTGDLIELKLPLVVDKIPAN